MQRSFLATLAVVLVLADSVFADGGKDNKDTNRDKAKNVSIVKVDASKGEITASSSPTTRARCRRRPSS